ncbi:MAG: hypothetical protein GOV00_04350 [Candidatus Altiarchaeota archaeon]|nr:hypothetical protein [Candidatus Altiarchaeota archaeon]
MQIPRRIDLVLLVIIFFSITFFLIKNPSNQITLEDIQLYEGEALPNAGRRGNVSVLTNNLLNKTLDCTFHMEVFQGLRLAFVNETNREVLPGRHLNFFDVFLPDGENKVVVNAKCK